MQCSGYNEVMIYVDMKPCCPSVQRLSASKMIDLAVVYHTFRRQKLADQLHCFMQYIREALKCSGFIYQFDIPRFCVRYLDWACNNILCKNL